MRSFLLVLLLFVVSGCGPRETAKSSTPSTAKGALAGRRCPDPNIRDAKDPCSPSYLSPYKPRFKRDKF